MGKVVGFYAGCGDLEVCRAVLGVCRGCPELGAQPWPCIVPICDAGKDSYGKTWASASWLAKCILNSEKAPFSVMLLFCKMIPDSESHSEGFGLPKSLEGVGGSGSGPV